jgi:DNA-nicking Smr family endonuclease
MARKLGPEEQKLWGRVIDTVSPLHPVRAKPATISIAKAKKVTAKAPLLKMPSKLVTPAKTTPAKTISKPPVLPLSSASLDGHWDRRIHKGVIVPDVSIDLHGTALSGAYARLDGALEMAIAQRLKVILLVTGKVRAHDRTSGSGRGAIAAVVRDWLSASRHASHISAVRNAHPRHGGDGALYIILKRG